LKFFYNFFFVDNLSDNDGDVVMKIQGKVLLYTSRDSIEPMMAMRQDVTPVLSDVLLGLSGKIFSHPKWVFVFSCYCQFLIFILRVQLSNLCS
jgi:hypothetical protein